MELSESQPDPDICMTSSSMEEEESNSITSTILTTQFKPLQSYDSLIPPHIVPEAGLPSVPWILIAWISALIIIVCQSAFFLNHLERELLPSLQLETPDWANKHVEVPPAGIAPVIIHSIDSICTEPYLIAIQTYAEDTESRHYFRNLYGKHLGIDARLIFPIGRVKGAMWESLDLHTYTEARRFDDMLIADFNEESIKSQRHGDRFLTALNYFYNSCPNGTLLTIVDPDQIINLPALLPAFVEMTLESFFEHNGVTADIHRDHFMAGRYLTADPPNERMMDLADELQKAYKLQAVEEDTDGLYHRLRGRREEEIKSTTRAITLAGEGLLGGILDPSFFFINRRLSKRILDQRLRFTHFEDDNLGILITQLLHKTLTSFVNIHDLYVDFLSWKSSSLTSKEVEGAIDCFNWWWGPRNITKNMEAEIEQLFDRCTEN